MTENLIIMATIKAKPSAEKLVEKELLKLIEPTLKEKGCIQYDLHKDNNEPNVFVFYEQWESRDLWQAHMNSKHLSDYMQNTQDAVAEFTLKEMTVCQ